MPDLPSISTPSTFGTRAAARTAEGRPATRPKRARDIEITTAPVIGREYRVDVPLVAGGDIEVVV